MAKIELQGLDAYDKKLRSLGAAGLGICKAATYEGADKVADAIRASIQSLPTISEGAAIAGWRKKDPVDAITEEQKHGLLKSLCLRKMREDGGFVYTQIGFVGYNEVETAKYSGGQPNIMIARSIESGSSARKKHPFVRPAVNKAKATAIARMEKKIAEMVNNIMK